MLYETFKAMKLRDGSITFNGKEYTLMILDDFIQINDINITIKEEYSIFSRLPTSEELLFVRKIIPPPFIFIDTDIDYFLTHGRQRSEFFEFFPTISILSDLETTKEIAETFLERRGDHLKLNGPSKELFKNLTVNFGE
jgi:hypothetical protein